MRIYSFLLTALLFVSSAGWETDPEIARKRATEEHKLILLNFSGSDWCIPCIRLHKDVFEASEFTEFAAGNLVLLNADFPRLKKNQLDKEARKRNDELAEKYNPEGTFPLTLLLDANGKVLKKWEGNPGLSPGQFISQVKPFTNASN